MKQRIYNTALTALNEHQNPHEKESEKNNAIMKTKLTIKQNLQNMETNPTEQQNDQINKMNILQEHYVFADFEQFLLNFSTNIMCFNRGTTTVSGLPHHGHSRLNTAKVW